MEIKSIEKISGFPAALFSNVPREHIEAFIQKEIEETELTDPIKFIQLACLKLAQKYPNQIKDILNFDLISCARQEIKRLNLDIEENALSFSWAQIYHSIQIQIQKSRNDTYRRMPLAQYEKIVLDLGFKLGLDLKFPYEKNKEEALKIWYHPLGVILKYDTWNNQSSVNGGSFSYNWKPTNSINSVYTESGSYYDIKDRPMSEYDKVPKEDWIWIGSHDCRDSLKLNFEGLRDNGTFLNPWFKTPFLWLYLHYVDTAKEYDYNQINRERIKLLPEEVQKMIGDYNYGK